MKLGHFEIENYTVNINGVDESRKSITYYDLENIEVTKERYYDDVDSILPNYTTSTNSPLRVTLWQFKAQLQLTPAVNVGFSNLKEEIDSILSQISGSQGVIVESAWNNANNISRLSPTVEFIGTQLGLTDPQIDDIFISGSLISL
jgi:HD-GYP domain-containing protein (c-di-GMP phosphodiesterase class II)